MKKMMLIGLMIFSQNAFAGPVLATVCGAVCGVVMESGCVAIGFALAPLVSPPAAAMIVASCGVLQTAGSIPACVAMCLMLPTP